MKFDALMTNSGINFIIEIVVFFFAWGWWIDTKPRRDAKRKIEQLTSELRLAKGALENYKRHLTAIRYPILMKNFVALDVETTGLKATESNIIQIAILRYSDMKLVEKFVTYVNPGVPIPDSATKVNNITNQMLKGAPRFIEIVYKVSHLLSQYPVVAHNLRFDITMVEAEFERLGLDAKVNWGYCTMGDEFLNRSNLKTRPNRYISLKNLSDKLQLSPVGPLHDAQTDAELAARIAIIYLRAMGSRTSPPTTSYPYNKIREYEANILKLEIDLHKAKVNLLS